MSITGRQTRVKYCILIIICLWLFTKYNYSIPVEPPSCQDICPFVFNRSVANKTNNI